jgi:hypothetical protein
MHYACARVIRKIKRNELRPQLLALQCPLRHLRLILFLAAASACVAQQTADFAGTWVLNSDGQAVMKLLVQVEKGRITGSLTEPKPLTIDQDGVATTIGPGQVQFPIQKAAFNGGPLELTIDGDQYVMTMEDHDRALLDVQVAGIRPWRLDRSPDGSKVTLATSLPEQEYPEEIRALRQQLRSMVTEDQDVRLAFNLTRMEAVDTKNRPEVLRIFERYGWVTNSLAGKDAAHDFWLLVQHQTPEIQQRFLPALEKAARDGNASMSDDAYLYDRVQMGLGKPQHWGSAAKCENGKPVLYPVDDPAGLEARRKELFLMSIREYLQSDMMLKFCAQAAH